MQKYPNMEIRMTNNPLNLFLNHFSFKFQLFLWEFSVLYLFAQSRQTLCHPVNCSLLGFSVHGILQARTLEWVAISFSNTVQR